LSASVYLDSSVVVASYVPERNSDHVQALFQVNNLPVISELVELEVIAAVVLRNRIGDLSRLQSEHILSLFTEHLDAGLYTRLRLQSDHYRWARDAIARFDLPLKSPDALHLAAARLAGLSITTADRQLARNAESLDVAFELVET
jgi:predicted nucleic acid-binding protein